jgi:AraC-like DNA-binding protein
MPKPAQRARPPSASIRLLWPFLALARKHGYGDAGDFVRKELGLSAAELDDPHTRVPVAKLARLLDLAIEAGQQRDLGLLAARLVDASHWGIGEYVARSRSTLKDALTIGARYLPLLGDGAHYRFESQGKLVVVSFWLDPAVRFHEAAYEFLVAIAVLRARRMTRNPELAPLEVRFTHARPADVARHERLFRCPVRFSAPVTQVVMSAKFLERPLAGAEPLLSQLLEQQADAMLDRLAPSKTMHARVRELLAGERDLRNAGAERSAKKLGLSVRTLARKLAEEGTSYRALFDDVREQVALRELTRTERSIAEIADALGFASPQGFQRAFRRWTRTSAARYRANARRRRR